MDLKAWLILLQVPPLIILLIIMAVASLVTLNLRVNDWTGQIQTHVLTEERDHIVALAENVALFTQRRFARMTSDTIVIRDYAQRLVDQDLVVDAPYTSYHFDSTVNSAAPTNNRLGSAWFRLGNSAASNQPFLDNSSAMDNAWRTLPSNLYSASGLGLESDGFLRAFPFSRSSTLGTRSLYCHLNNTQVTGYDPRCRNWYVGAKANAPNVFFTTPYVDALDSTSSVIISSAAAVMSPTDSTKTFAVVFNDIQFTDLETFFAGSKILDTGFPFLLDDTTAQLLYYPNQDRASPQYFRTLHFGSETSAESVAFGTTFNTSAAQAKLTFKTVSFTFTKDGEPWEGSVSSVNGTSYLVGVVVPEADIRKPVEDVIARAKGALVAALIIIIIVIVLMLILSIVMNTVFATTIDTAIYGLLKITERFAAGDFSDHDSSQSNLMEVYNIQASFHNLALAVQFSNPDYFKDDIAGALKVSLKVETMLIECDNQRGLGTVQNNIALHCRTLDPRKEYTHSTVVKYLRKSVAAGEAVLEKEMLLLTGNRALEEEMQRQYSFLGDGPQTKKFDEHRSSEMAVNNRQLNLLAVRESVDTEQYDAIINKARSLLDASGMVSAFLRHAEALELKHRTAEALERRILAVRESCHLLTEVLRSPKQQRTPAVMKDVCDAVVDSAYHMSIVRQGESFDDESKRIAMHQYLSLALLAAALMDEAGLPRNGHVTPVQVLYAHSLAKRGELAASTAMVEELNLKLDAKKDLKPVAPTGPSVTVENLLSGEAQEVDGFYNTDAVNGDFGNDVQYDQYGNPIGSNNELAKDGSFKGVHILIGLFYLWEGMKEDVKALVIPALEKKGFTVHVENRESKFADRLDPKHYAVAWIVSSHEAPYGGTKTKFQKAVRKFHEAGRGLMIWGDNDPFYGQANVILEDLFNMRLTGNTPGNYELTPGDGFEKGHFSRDHLISTGILKIYEGVTICYPEYKDASGRWGVKEAEGWTRIGTSSDNYAVLVARDAELTGPGRVVVDNGFTKMMKDYWATAGNARYVSNCNAWLCMMERPENRPPVVLPPAPPVVAEARTQVNGARVSDRQKPKLYTLRMSMAIRFGLAYFIFILLVFVVCLVVSLTTTDRVKVDLRDALEDQVQRQATSLMKGAAMAFGEDLATASESGTQMIGQATADVFRTSPPYCLKPRTSYYDLGGTTTADFKQPLQFVHGFSSSLHASSLYVPGELGNASVLNSTVNATVDTTSNLDPFFASIYGQKKDEYFNLAAAFKENSLFRRMPAIDTNIFDPTRSYDPTARSWYTAAMAAPGSSIYTTPYRDFNTNRWMVSVSSAGQLDNATAVGVASVDILLATLVESIRSLRVLDSGKVTLVDYTQGSTSSATVVADQEWAMSDSVATVFTLNSLTSPQVTASMQAFITKTPLVAEASHTRAETFTTTYSGGSGQEKVMVIPTRLSGYGDRYYFIAFLKESEVFAPFEPVLAEVESVNATLSVVLVAIWLFASLVAALTIYLAASMLAKPIITIEGNVQRMVENVGSSDLTQGCEDINSAPYHSASELAKNFNSMVATMRASAERDAGSPVTAGAAYSKRYLSWMKYVPACNRQGAGPVLPVGTDALAVVWNGATLESGGEPFS